jgi:FdhD protein
MTGAGTHAVTYTGYYDAEHRPVRGVVPVEDAVTLRVNGQPLVKLMCTPVQLEELATGFLFNQGLIEALDELVGVEFRDDDQCLDVRLHHDLKVPELRVFTSGYSGGATFEDLTHACRQVESDLRLTPQQVAGLMEEFSRASPLYRRAGGVHGAALADGERLLCIAEDVGRNNALDKVMGLCMRRGLHMCGHVLLVTGRVSSEILHKVARMGVAIVVSRKSPTSLSVRLAQACGITLIGYTRRRSFRVYAGVERVVAETQGVQ